ncbi:MAG: succinyl-diaminopimelate desuccinylase [Gammaproteobacteria bacterium]|nr:succinyl-diaminopimelate desuccinylase [Gammaproteobacteria bacterium]
MTSPETALTNDVLALTEALIARPSVSPEDGGCQDLLLDRLERAGFTVERMRFGPVDNFWAEHAVAGGTAPRLIFAGHTDVVPAGPLADWDSPPFQPTRRDGYLYGRGAADMKSSLAAMVAAAERFVTAHPDHLGALAFLVTSDEEDLAVDGTRRVVDALVARGERLDYCVVGEPSSSACLGDVVRVGRRGSLNGVAKVRGVQGHVAYPDQAVNPIHAAARALRDLVEVRWDDGDDDFPPTSFQVSNINAGTGATNVVPGELECRFNFRFNPTQTPDGLQAAVAGAFAAADADCELDWRLSGLPFITRGGELIEAVREAIEAVTGTRTVTSTSGGTSDGRFIAPAGAEVVEIGPVNATIHKRNERVAIADLAPLARIYQRVMTNLLI